MSERMCEQKVKLHIDILLRQYTTYIVSQNSEKNHEKFG